MIIKYLTNRINALKGQKSAKVFSLIILVTIICSCNSGKNVENPETKNVINQVFLENVKTVKAILSNQERELILTGKVEYDPDKVIHYVPLISGIADKTCFSLGDRVSKGQTMLHIRSSELSSLQSELVIARRNLQSAEAMYEDRLIPEKELIEARSTYEKLQADLSLYGENMGSGIFSIKAPMSGYVVHKNISAGSTVSADGDPVFIIADLSTVWITANVYASNLLAVGEGMAVEITTLSYPDEVFYGKINSLSQVFDPEEKVLKARIIMNNKDLKLKPEMSILVKVRDKTPQRLVAIPSDALIFDDNQYFAVVKEASGSFAIRNVVLQGHHNHTSYILSGLAEGECVVIENQLLIYSGLREKIE